MFVYLYQHIARSLHTAIHIYDASFSEDHPDAIFSWAAPDAVPDTSARHLILQYLLSEQADFSMPELITAYGNVHYLTIPTDGRICLIGPLRLNDTLLCRFSLKQEAAESYRELLSAQFPASAKWLESFISATLSDCIDAMLLLYNLERTGNLEQPFLQKETVLSHNFSDISIPEENLKKLSETEFSFIEEGTVHNPYLHEVKECASIRDGDIDELLRLQNIDYSKRFGKLSSSPVRDKIYHGIVAVTMASRSAINGGVHPETAFHLSDIIIQKLDTCKDTISPVKIYKAAQLQYAQLVREADHQENTSAPENRYISLCKDYVFTHLHGKITVREIAGAIGLDANYLSSLFRKCEKITLKQFIMNEKIKLAKNLLTYSSYSYSQIATYLGFSSQSHMGTEFKKATGMTPHAFRLENTNEDFISNSLEYSAES